MRSSIRDHSRSLRSQIHLTRERSRVAKTINRLARLMLVLAALAAGTTAATAQNINIDAGIDIQLFRSDAAVGASPKPQPVAPPLAPCAPGDEKCEAAAKAAKLLAFQHPPIPGYELTFSAIAPLYYNTNPTTSESSPRDALEGNPELILNWKHEVGGIVLLVGKLDANSDRFTNNPTEGSDKAIGSIAAQFTDGTKAAGYNFIPLISYGPTLVFDPTFAHRIQTANDFAVGMSKAWGYTADWQPYKLTDQPPDYPTAATWQFSIPATVQRRFKDPSPSSTAIAVGPSVQYRYSDAWTVYGQVNISGRFYDSVADFNRRDWLVSPTMGVAWQPPKSWFGSNSWKDLGEPVINFQVSYNYQHSNKAGGNFHQLSVGPALSLAWGLF